MGMQPSAAGNRHDSWQEGESMQRLPQVRCCCQGCLLPAQSPHSPLPLPTPTPTRTPTCTAARRKRSCIATRSSRIIRFSESCWSAVRTASSTVWRSQAARSRSSAAGVGGWVGGGRGREGQGQGAEERMFHYNKEGISCLGTSCRVGAARHASWQEQARTLGSVKKSSRGSLLPDTEPAPCRSSSSLISPNA